MRTLAVLALCILSGPAAADRFVLAPGAWQGADAWDAVAAALEAAGHEVVAVEFKGQGARADEGGSGVTVEDNVADVLAALDAPEPSILVAFSWGGRPATGAWDRARDRVAAAVWVEAPFPLGPDGLPADGESLAFIVTFQPDDASRGVLPPPPGAHDDPDHPLNPMSLRSLYDPVPVAGGPFPPGTFVYAADSSLPVLRQIGEALRDRDGWSLREVPGGHDVLREAPDALAAILIEVADAT